MYFNFNFVIYMKLVKITIIKVRVNLLISGATEWI
jgi:hypothetical protein